VTVFKTAKDEQVVSVAHLADQGEDDEDGDEDTNGEESEGAEE